MSAVHALAYPSTQFEPTGLVDLSSKAERERLSGSALKGFFNLASKWNLKDEDARELLGGISNSAFYEWKKAPQRLLDVDRITRISFLIGIYKALHILYGDKLADEWVSLPNKNAIFAGRTPLQYMLSGGLIGMQTVRKLLDARRGGI
ncbi:MbcA/ParS/Xre antitoxin family protein [Rhodoferax ferrireducens]|uniref:MbcA/ParS/Xre antitoxin family protein n=1 Tax=Rhodoferax ferrireducens TaxID=192843 RepID=UPI000E0DBA75|nr:MbcA/ParS/Xre antitoxin family protein [Rhodoferax ferrireducens]